MNHWLSPSLLLCCLLFTFVGTSQVINEVQPANATTWVDDAGDFDDWIEIHNPGATPLDLSGLYLSDNNDDLNHFQLPDDDALIIAPGGYLVLVADGEPDEGPLHLGFSLKQGGDQVYISDEDGLITFAEFGFLWQDHSAGLDGDGNWSTFDVPTPELDNFTAALVGTLDAPEAFPPALLSPDPAGDPQSLVLYHDILDAEIRYTTDGSVPSEASTLYTEPIVVDGSMTVKARAFHPLFVHSPTLSAPFLYEVNTELHVISISCIAEEFDFPSGIDNLNSDTEIIVDASFFEPGGALMDSQTMGMKRHATDNHDQHGYRLHSRGVYGKSKLELPLFALREHNTHDVIIMRNSGNDAIEANGAGLRDPLIHQLFHAMDPNYGMSDYTPVVTYINGEYWGMYNLRERQDAKWMETNFGLQCDEMDYLERTAEQSDTRDEFCGNWNAFDTMETEALDWDLSDNDIYEGFIEQIHLRNLIDYQSIEVWAVNQDWLSNNTKLWSRYSNPKWNWVLWDVDWGLGTFYPSYPHGYPDWNALSFSLSNWGGWTSAVETETMQNLIENEGFVADYATRSADLLNSVLRPDRVSDRLLNMQDVVAAEIPTHVERWDGSESGWESEVEYMVSFIEDRPDHMRAHFSEMFELGEQLPVTLDCLPVGAGYMEVNTIYTDEIPWEGIYYENLQVRLKAIANSGFTFQYWEGLPEGADVEASEIWINVADAPEVTAVFEEFDPEVVSIPVISEIMYRSTPLTQDWVELYNPGPEAIQLGDWQLCDEASCWDFPETILEVGEYIVVAEQLALFQSYYGSAINAVGDLPFGLSSSGETLYASHPELGLIDLVEYSSTPPWPIVPVDGQSIQLLDNGLDNNLGPSWHTLANNETPGASNALTTVAELDPQELSVFPNPFSELLTIGWDNTLAGKATLTFFDLHGKSVFETSVNLSGVSKRLVVRSSDYPALDALPPQMYVVQLSNGNGSFRSRVIKR